MKSNKIILVATLLISIVLFTLVLYFSYEDKELIGCGRDLKICSDGSSVGRDPNNNCEFFPCPDGNKNYINYDLEECKLINFLCVEGTVRFDDEIGCGCEPEEKNFCTPESREADACITLYEPVCGFSEDDFSLSTYSNSCVACQNKEVLYWTEGECPSP